MRPFSMHIEIALDDEPDDPYDFLRITRSKSNIVTVELIRDARGTPETWAKMRIDFEEEPPVTYYPSRITTTGEKLD